MSSVIGAITSPRLAIVTEYMSRGSLYSVLHSDMYKGIPLIGRKKMALDMALGMQYLHSMKIMHRDIKSHNMLLDEDWKVKVADFGASKFNLENKEGFTEIGTSGWVAPEILSGDGYNGFSADVYSFGIVLWELIAGDQTNPLIGLPPVKYYNAIQRGTRPPMDALVDKSFQSLVHKCWASSPTDRPTFDDIVKDLQSMVDEERE